MKVFFLVISTLLLHSCRAIPASQNPEKLYDAGVGFNSICCGAPSDQFLKTFVKQFNKTNKVKVTADKIAGCGREGEYVVLFHTRKLKAATKKKFIAELEKLVPQQDIKNKKADGSSGGMEVLRNVKLSAYSHCRISPQNWLYEK
jgi:hypothetical protein